MTGEEKPGMGAAETGTAGIGAVGIRAAGAGIRAQLRSEVMEEIQDLSLIHISEPTRH